MSLSPHRGNSRLRGAAWLLSVSLLTGTVVGADQQETVQRFLSRLGLVDLQILQLEKSLQGARDDSQRRSLARQLADLYAERLMSVGDDGERFQELTRRVDALVRQTPEANTAALQVMLLQADFNRAESQMIRWMDEGGGQPLQSAREVLLRIAPRLDRVQQELHDACDELLLGLESIRDSDLRTAREQELQRRQSVAGRAAYFAGWSNYYLGLTVEDPQAARVALLSARQALRQLLGIERQEDYSEVDVAWLGLESIWRSRAVVGLALTEGALGNAAASDACFEMLGGASTPPAIRDQAPYWRFQGLTTSGRWDDAVRYARDRLADFRTDRATAGNVGFCAALMRAASRRAAAPSTAAAWQLAELGIQGLSRLGQADAVAGILARYPLDLAGAQGFYLTWAQGLQRLARAEQSGQQADYRAAAEMLERALQADPAADDARTTADCRQRWALCLYRLERYDVAAEQFRRAAESLQLIDRELAVKAAWNAVVAVMRLAQQQDRFAAAALELLGWIQTEFPGTSEAQQAQLYAARLRQRGGSMEEALRGLEQISPEDSHYRAARFEICSLRRQIWSQAAEGQAKQAAAAAALACLDQWLQTPPPPDGDRQRLQCALWKAEIVLQTAGAELARAAESLQDAAVIAASLPPDDPLAQEHHYRSMQLAQRQGDAAARRMHAQWLADQAAGSAFEIPALIALALLADEAVSASAPEQLDEHRQAALLIYRRLAPRLGDTPPALLESRSALAASSKLAHYEYEAGHYAAAADQLDKIVQAYPHDKSYLRRAGLACLDAGRLEAALTRWRALLAGLPSGSPAWLEAKYYQLVCLTRLDKSLARKVYRQFQLLHPDVASDVWREKFTALARELAD